MATAGGAVHLQEPKSGPSGYPLQPRTPLRILVSSTFVYNSNELTFP